MISVESKEHFGVDVGAATIMMNVFTEELLFFLIILSGCYAMTNRKNLSNLLYSSTRPKELSSPKCKNIAEEIKECGNCPSWLKSMIGPLMVLDMWERVDHCEADLQTFYFLVNAYIRVNRGQMVLPLLEEMSRLNVQRTKDFYESTIRQLAAKKCFGYALVVMNAMELEMAPEVEATTYSCAVNFCAHIGDVDNCLRYFKKLTHMTTPSLKATMVVFRLLNKIEDCPMILEILSFIKENEVLVDGFILNQALSTLVNMGRVDDVRDILFDEFYANVRTQISFNLYLKALSRQLDVEHYNRAVEIIDFMEASEKFQPSQISYNTVIDLAVKANQEEAPWVLAKRMEKASILPDEYTTSILVRSLNKNSSIQKLTVVKDYIKKMKNINESKMNLERLLSGLLDYARKFGGKLHSELDEMLQSVRNDKQCKRRQQSRQVIELCENVIY